MFRLTISSITLVALLVSPGLAQETDMTMIPSQNLIDFTESPPRTWFVVNDGVMGGLSRSAMRVTSRSTGEFSGTLSLENNGGFASVRTAVPAFDFSPFSGVELRVRGDGRTYQLRFRTDDRFDGVAYRALFATQAGSWTTVFLPFSSFEPTFRGRVLGGRPPLDTAQLAQMTLMIADKKPGPFKLEVGWIRAIVQGN